MTAVADADADAAKAVNAAKADDGKSDPFVSAIAEASDTIRRKLEVSHWNGHWQMSLGRESLTLLHPYPIKHAM